MFDEYDVVILVHPEEGVPIAVGTRGTILIDHNAEPTAYEIEFVDEAGESLGSFSVKGESIKIAPDA